MKSENLDLAVRIRNIMRGQLTIRENHEKTGEPWIDGITAAAMRITDVVEGLD